MEVEDRVGVISSFEDLPLDERILANIRDAGFTEPTPIQAHFVPVALSGRDCIGQAQTGTGKTLAFLIPLCQAIAPPKNEPQALVLVPTRELAVQCYEEAKWLTYDTDLSMVVLCGGHPMKKQSHKLQRGVHLAIGTPGRVLHHIRSKALRLRGIRQVVLDEADRMLDIGFRPDIERILRGMPRNRQNMLLSATMSQAVRGLANKYMESPTVIDLSPKSLTVESITQRYFTVDENKKFELLLHLIGRDNPERCIIFCRRKRDAEFLAHDLAAKHQRVARMHGDLQQTQRNRIMQRFRSGKVRFLVSTDLVGRGIDVDNISHVINYDIPEDPEDYVHRIGRTARMGRNGVAYTFVTPDQGKELTSIEMLVNTLLENDQIEGFEAFRKRRA